MPAPRNIANDPETFTAKFFVLVVELLNAQTIGQTVFLCPEGSKVTKPLLRHFFALMEGERECIAVKIDARYDTSKVLSDQFYSFHLMQAQQLQNAHCLQQTHLFVLELHCLQIVLDALQKMQLPQNPKILRCHLH